MRIAFIIPKLSNHGPIIVAKDIIEYLTINKSCEIDVFYFDKEVEININCNSIRRIGLFERIDFDYYEIVHSHMLRPDFYIWYHRPVSKTTSFISTLHQNIFENLKGNYNAFIAFYFEKLWIKFINKQDVVVSLTDSMRKHYSSRIKSKMITIYNGRNLSTKKLADLSSEELSFLNDLKKSYKIIGAHCLLTKRKGIHQLVQALASLDNYALLIIGDGPELDNLKILAKKLKVDNRCVFLGYKKNATDYLIFFDLYVMSSYSEGFPLGLLEAAMYGLPVVCSRINIFQELFSELEVEFFEIDNIHSLSTSIENCYTKRHELGSSIKEKVLENYSTRSMAEKYFQLYKQIS